MKKAIALILFVLVAVSLSAWDMIDEFKDPKSYIPDQILLFTGNDKFNHGVTRNDDDQLSYSFDFQVEAPLWYARFDANGFTNRGWRAGWDIRDHDKEYDEGAEVNRGRFDSLETVVALKLRLLDKKFYIHLYPEIGFSLVGDYGWEWGQNAIHRMLNIHIVDLPYDNDAAKNVFLMLDARMNMGYRLVDFARSSLVVEMEATTKNIMGFMSENQILGRLSISTSSHDLLGLHFGYGFASALGDYPSYTRDLYLQYVNGWKFGFTVDAGVMFLKYTGSPETGFGYGYLGFDVLAFFEPRRWEQTDAWMSFSKATFYGSFYNYITVGIPVADKLEIILKNSYLGGNPINKSEEQTADLNKMERLKREYASTTIGLRYNFPSFAKNYIHPYVELSGGLQIFKIFLLFNQLDDGFFYYGNIPSYLIDDLGNYFGLLNLEAGITVLPENLLVFEDTSIQLEVFGGVNLVLGGDTKDITMYRYIHKIWIDPAFPADDRGFAARVIPYAGFGVKFGFDL